MKCRSFVTLFSAAVLAAGTITPAFAQYHEYASSDPDCRSGSDYDNGAAQRWNRFLDQEENQNFARRFRGNPNIVRDSREMDQWSGVRELFSNHPDVRDYVYRKVHDYNQDTRPAEKWNRELAANPNFADRYRQNPSIIDSNLESEEPEIAEFLRTNPDVRPYLERNSRRSDRDYRNDRDDDLRADSGLNSFMASHPNVARQLRDNPSLINDPDFVRSHPNLHEYLRDHPEARY
jgi:hypothetical protein